VVPRRKVQARQREAIVERERAARAEQRERRREERQRGLLLLILPSGPSKCVVKLKEAASGGRGLDTIDNHYPRAP